MIINSINSNINAQTVFSKLPNSNTQEAQKSENNDRFTSVFTLPESGVYNKNVGQNTVADKINYSVNSILKAETESISKNIKKLEDKDKLAVARLAHSSMKNIVAKAKAANENAVEEFKSLEEEKAYYQGVLTDKNNVYRENGQYLLSGKATGEIISKDDVKSALDDVQSRIDSLIKNDDSDSSSQKKDIISDLYSYNASVFAAATGKSSDALKFGNNDSIFGMWDRTEENFLDEAQKAIDELDSRSKGLDNALSEFETTLEDKGINTHISVPSLAVQDVINEYSDTVKLINEQFNGNDALNANKKAVLQYISSDYSYMLNE